MIVANLTWQHAVVDITLIIALLIFAIAYMIFKI